MSVTKTHSTALSFAHLTKKKENVTIYFYHEQFFENVFERKSCKQSII